MKSKINVSDIEITDLMPKIKNPAFEKYLPKTLKKKRMSFQISGVNNAESNAIRRTIGCELLVSGLHAEYENIKTNDLFIIPEMMVQRFRMIPIDQNTPLDAIFELDVINKTPNVIEVKSSEMRIVSSGKGTKERPALKKLPFNETFTLLTLEPGKYIKITDIGIHQDYGFREGYGTHVVAVNATSTAVDQKPINMYEPEAGGIPSAISNPKVWKISFNTNGTMEPKDIIVAACDNIIGRINSISELLYWIENNNDEYILTVNGESDTIGNLLMRTISDIFPDIRAVTYSTSSVGRILTVRIRCDEDINTIYNNSIKHIVQVFTEIKKYFE
ncbi:putative DNA-directed RNA polymerase subunit IIi [Pacmanvirus S19]|nr:putative DNA-directed RNA polymerase subunit IIi [Pacmanvirus S19]